MTERTDLPIFHEYPADKDIPEGFGIDENHDGWFYTYSIVEGAAIYHQDYIGRDLSFSSYEEALGYLHAVDKEARHGGQ